MKAIFTMNPVRKTFRKMIKEAFINVSIITIMGINKNVRTRKLIFFSIKLLAKLPEQQRLNIINQISAS